MKILDIRDKVAESGKQFIKNIKNEIFVLGTNKYGIQTAEFLESHGYAIKGYINDQAEILTFGKKRVYRSTEIQSGSNIINCIVEGRTIDAEESIRALKPAAVTDYFSLQLAFPGELKEIDFLNDSSSIENDTKRYDVLFGMLEDSESKSTLENLINFRFNRDINFLKNFRFKLNEQYFERFIDLDISPVFVDGGGFDGCTTKLFAEKYPEYQSIWYFEPNKLSLEKSKEKLSGLKKIYYFKKGLWDNTENLYFDDSLGPASKLSESGSTIVETISIDEAVKDKISYMKLDIEGAEYNALKGSVNTIKESVPKLAVCVYHLQEDFLRIPELILSYNPEYKIFLRHYTQGVFETVMYFV